MASRWLIQSRGPDGQTTQSHARMHIKGSVPPSRVTLPRRRAARCPHPPNTPDDPQLGRPRRPTARQAAFVDAAQPRPLAGSRRHQTPPTENNPPIIRAQSVPAFAEGECQRSQKPCHIGPVFDLQSVQKEEAREGRKPCQSRPDGGGADWEAQKGHILPKATATRWVGILLPLPPRYRDRRACACSKEIQSYHCVEL